MFIKNASNELINLSHVTYLRVYGDRAPYEIHVFIGNDRMCLQYDNEYVMRDALGKIMRALNREYPRWIELPNPEYYIRADKVKGILHWHNGIKVIFQEGELVIYASGDQTPDNYLVRMASSLGEIWYDSQDLLDM